MSISGDGSRWDDGDGHRPGARPTVIAMGQTTARAGSTREPRNRGSSLCLLLDHGGDDDWRASRLGEQLRAQLRIDRCGDFGVLLQIQARVVLALADAVAVVAVPGAGFLDEVVGDAELDQL